MIAFLKDRRITFSDIEMQAQNLQTGFEFDVALEDLDVSQDAGFPPAIDLTVNGVVNGQNFDITGRFPAQDPFAVTGRVATTDFELTGTGIEGGTPVDFDGLLKIQSSDLQDILDTVRLKGDIAGQGVGSASLRHRNGAVSIEDIDVTTTMKDGAEFALSGFFNEQRTTREFDLRLGFNRFAAGEEPQEALFLRDVQLTAFDLRTIGDGDVIEIESLTVETNAFDDELRNIGPFRVEDLRRTEDGRLQLKGLTLSLGPPETPAILLTGDVADLLAFKGYSLSGILDLPAENVLLTLRPEEAKAFGRVTGTLELSEVDGLPELHHLTIVSEDNDLWRGSLNAQAKDLKSFQDVSFELELGAADAATFLSAVRLEPIDLGAFEVFLNAQRSRASVMADAGIQFGGSRLDVDIDARIRQSTPIVRGTVRSDQIRIADLQKIVQTAVELTRAQKVWKELRAAEVANRTQAQSDFKALVVTPDQPDISDFKPLIVDTSPPPEIDLSEFKPLVVEPAREQTPSLDGFKPLVLTDGAGDLSLAIFRDPERLIEIIDAEIALDIKELKGQAGISKIQSDLIVRDGKLDFGPLSLNYGGGFFTVHAGLDVVRAPDWLRIKGRTSGWDIGKILPSVGLDIGAAGILAAQFDVTGKHDPISAYLDTLRGQATIEMANGRIDSSLIELSGLGVVPWLFSRELQRGWARVVCLNAPLSMNSGRVNINDAVMETDRVQLVAKGTIDIPGDQINVRADPRPVGRPLARSAWPIEISGSISEPNIGIADRRSWRMLQPLAMPENRAPCVPDAAQLQPVQQGP